MKRLVLRFAVPLAVAVALPAATLSGQMRPSPFIGGGVLSPMSTFGDYAKTGYIVFGGVDFPVSAVEGLSLGVTVSYGHADHDDPSDPGASTDVPGAFVEGSYALARARVIPFVRVGVGFVQHKYNPGDLGGESTTDTKFAFGGGAGLFVPFSPMGAFAGAHYVGGDSDTSFLIYYAGLSFNVPAMAALRFR